ncbi:MAG: Methyltransferase type 12 [Parcubacteria group bacterium GW2011_GWF2_46_8]|nr:MAG: Methyltransferase type 12 [Parcubacteria group bacterium GW2011_GWF2_46_8]
MNYKDKIYDRYVSLQTSNILKIQTFAEFEKQFPVWDKYFGDILTCKDAAIVDVACGNGDLVHWLNTRGYKNVVGIDISEEQVSVAQGLGLGNVSRADFREYLKEKIDYFDAVFALDILEHFPKAEMLEAVDLFFRSLKKGGLLIIKMPNGDSPFFGRYAFGDFTHETIMTDRSFKEVFSFIGFREYQFKEAGPIPHGVFSFVRYCLWQLSRLVVNVYLLAETGRRGNVLTQNIIAIAKK